jgi:hypothetical protein
VQSQNALSPTERFEQEAATTAQGILQSNRDRLDAQQQQYTQDQNPSSPHWKQLWKVTAQRNELRTTEQKLVDERMRVIEELNTGTGLALDPLYDTQQDKTRKEQRRAQLEARQTTLNAEIDQIRLAQVTLEFQYPAIRAVRQTLWGWGGIEKDPKAVLSRMSGEFKGIRNNIDQLSKELAENPAAVRNLDSVVAAQLQQWRQDKSIPPAQIDQLAKSLKDAKETKQRNEQVSGFVGGAITIGSLFLPGGAPLWVIQALRLGGASLSMYSAASSLPDLMVLNKATQAQRGGAGELTSQSEGEAQFNLVMGYTNLVLAGVDVGAPQLVQRLVRYTGTEGIQLLSKLDRTTLQKVLRAVQSGATGQSPEWIEAMNSLKQATGNDQGLYNRLVNAIERAGGDREIGLLCLD